MPFFFFLPTTIFIVVFLLIIVAFIKNAKNVRSMQDKTMDTFDSILSNNVFEIKKEEEQECVCEYCGSRVSAGIKKCPNCSANLKKGNY